VGEGTRVGTSVAAAVGVFCNGWEGVTVAAPGKTSELEVELPPGAQEANNKIIMTNKINSFDRILTIHSI
jgi:hypothetical protein